MNIEISPANDPEPESSKITQGTIKMTAKISPNHLLQFMTVAIISIFIFGFVYSPLGVWTGAIIGAWFIGTQKAWRGFLILTGINFILSLLSNEKDFPSNGINYVSWTMLVVLISVLPFLFYRLMSQRQHGFLSTLSLPFWGVALKAIGQLFLPVTANSITYISLFFIYWFAAVILWIWNKEFRDNKIAKGLCVFSVACIFILGNSLIQYITNLFAPLDLSINLVFAWICFVGGLILSAWSLIHPEIKNELWANKTDTVTLLQSPYTGDSLHVVSEDGHEFLISQSGEKFPIRKGIPIFLKPEKLTGSNRKYNRLYETIGGFYDDSQKVACALRGISPDQYFLSYLRFLEINPGDSVLETSVGTGLNYKYIPHSARLFGLDLSAEMLMNCQANLYRWEMDADLFLGNAEDLPFANDSFDVVFHSGGINFFNDRAKAIREMIRVAKPGTRILIADETEEHVKVAYERFPVVSGYFKNRKEPVTAPIDLVPSDMHEIHLEILGGRFYVLTFRKPSVGL